MKNLSFKPLNFINGKVRIPLQPEDVLDEDIYEDMWLDGDDKEADIMHLLEQNRFRK